MGELSRWDMYSFLMNSMIGAGVLAIPKAFQDAGALACTAVLILVALLGWLMAREILAITDKLTQAKAAEKKCELTDSLLESSTTHQWDLPEIVRALLGIK